MMSTSNILMTYDDYEIINDYLKGINAYKAFDTNNAGILQEELKKAKLVKKDELPKDVIRLYSKVLVKEASKDKVMELVLVLPEDADLKSRKVSVFTPIGTALIGFRQGESVDWQLPSGRKSFTIVKVDN